jgi:hypothetical protein
MTIIEKIELRAVACGFQLVGFMRVGLFLPTKASA